MSERAIVPIGQLLKEVLPNDWVNEINAVLEFIGIDGAVSETDWDSEGFSTLQRIIILQVINVEIPFLSGTSLFIGTGATDLPYFDIRVKTSPLFKLSIENFHFGLHFPPNILQAYIKNTEGIWIPEETITGYDLAFRSGVSVDGEGDFDFSVASPETITPAQLGTTGIILDIEDIRIISGSIPSDLIEERIPFNFKGLWIGRATFHFIKEGTNFPPIELYKAGIGTSGFSGTVSLGERSRAEEDLPESILRPPTDGTPISIPGHLVVLNPEGARVSEMSVIFQYFGLTFFQSIPVACLITGHLFMPFADKWMKFKASLGGPDSDFMLEIGGAADAPLISLEHELFEIKADSIAYKLQDEIHYAIITGSIKPKIEGFDWPEMKVDGLSISSEGDISIPGGWLKAPNEITFDFKAFKIGISEIGFGNEGEEEATKKQWLGFSGSINLVEGLELGASVEGLKFSWLKDRSGPVEVSMKGIAVEFEIPNTLSFTGSVKYETLNEENNGGTGLTGDLFKGNIKLNLMAVRLEIEAELMIGKLKDAEGHEFTTFFIVLGAELPTGLPLGATGTSLYGIKGLAAIHAGPTKTEEQNWYEWYMTEPERNVTSIDKWKPIYDEYGFGAGVTIGTMYDDGFTLNMSVMLVVLIPGPVIILEGKANILKQRSADKEEEGAFYLLAVLDGRAGTFMINIDVKYSLEDVITVGAGLEAFFDFNNSSNWYLHIGKKEPEDKRIRAEILSLFKASAYFMIDSKSLLFGASVGLDIRKSFGPVSFALVAKISMDAGIFWKPLQMQGSLEMEAEISLKVFGIGLELYLYLLLEGKVPEPYWIHGVAKIGISLFWPIPDIELEVDFTWEQPGEVQPVLPFLKECSFIHHKDNGATWALELHSEDLRATDLEAITMIPIDARPILTFARPVHNLKRHESSGTRMPLLSLLSDEVGGKSLEYKMDELELQEWTAAGWEPLRTGINTGLDDEFIIDHDSIRNLDEGEGIEPNEPQIALWRYQAADSEGSYQREDFVNRHPPCNPVTTQKWITVDWRGVAPNTRYDYQFEYAGLRFISDEISGGQKPQVSSSFYLHTPQLFIQFPEPVYQIAIYLTQIINPATHVTASASLGGYVTWQGNRLGDMTLAGSALIFRGLTPIDGVRIESRSLIITSIVYMTQKSLVEQIVRTNDRHPNVTEQNTNGELVLSPATFYRLKVATSVDVDGSTRPDTISSNYVYFRTDEGPGIPILQDGLPTTTEPTQLAYKEKPVQQFTTYVERTLPIDGARNFYSSYDMGIQFNESYVPLMFLNDIRMIVRDRNGKTLEEPVGAFMDGFLPLMPPGLLVWLQGMESGGCATAIPATPAPYLNFVTSLPFKSNSLYTSEIVTLGSGGDQQLHKFQFTTSRYVSFSDHILSNYPDNRIVAIELPRITSPRSDSPIFSNSTTNVLNNQISTYKRHVGAFYASNDTLIKSNLLLEINKTNDAINKESEAIFNIFDDIMNRSLRTVQMENRPAATKFEIFSIPLNINSVLLVLESPEPIDWLRIQAKAKLGSGSNIGLNFSWNRDKTRAFVFQRSGFIFKKDHYMTSFSYSGKPDPLTGVLLKEGLEINERVTFNLEVS